MGCTASSSLRGLALPRPLEVPPSATDALQRHLARISDSGGHGAEVNIGDQVMKPWTSGEGDDDIEPVDDIRKVKRQLSENGPLIVFLFGGPSSRKGRVIDDLQEGYNFRLISGEELIFSELPRKLANVVELCNPTQIRKLIEDDPSYITLDWLLSQLERRISVMTLTSGSDTGSARFLVDLVPNLRYLLRANSFASTSVSESLAKFEQRFPIAFALNLSVSKDCKTKDLKTAKFCHQESGDSAASDEADHHRKLKRELLYMESVRGFLEYFEACRTLEIVITDDMTPDLVARVVMATIQTQLHIHRCHTVNGVTLFSFDVKDIKDIDVVKHNMEVLEASELLMLNPDTSTEIILEDLKNRINDKINIDCFILKLDKTLLTRDNEVQLQKRYPLVFVEPCPVSRSPSSCGDYHEYSSPGNHTYLFADRLQPQICRRLLNTLIS